MMEKKRIEFIDLAKGICIVLVVLFHCDICFPGLVYFMLPTYFVLSGLFFKRIDFIPFLIKKVNTLAIPFIFYFILGFAIYKSLTYLLPGVRLNSATSEFNLLDPFYSRAMFNNPLWFLLALLGTNFIFYFLTIISGNKLIQFALVLGFTTIAMLLHNNIELVFPFYLYDSFRYLPFFYIGTLLSKTPFLYKSRYDKYNIYMITILILIFYSVILSGLVCNILIDYAISVIGVLALLLACKVIGNVPFISYYGRFSLVVLCTHHLVYRPIEFILQNFIFNITALNLSVFFLTLLAEIPVIYVCIHYLGYVNAQKDVFVLNQKQE